VVPHPDGFLSSIVSRELGGALTHKKKPRIQKRSINIPGLFQKSLFLEICNREKKTRFFDVNANAKKETHVQGMITTGFDATSC
jgi:hypothetical protein